MAYTHPSGVVAVVVNLEYGIDVARLILGSTHFEVSAAVALRGVHRVVADCKRRVVLSLILFV